MPVAVQAAAMAGPVVKVEVAAQAAARLPDAAPAVVAVSARLDVEVAATVEAVSGQPDVEAAVEHP